MQGENKKRVSRSMVNLATVLRWQDRLDSANNFYASGPYPRSLVPTAPAIRHCPRSYSYECCDSKTAHYGRCGAPLAPVLSLGLTGQSFGDDHPALPITIWALGGRFTDGACSMGRTPLGRAQ